MAQKVSDTKDEILTRVSEIDRTDVINSTVAWWKVIYQFLFVLVTFIILTPFGIDIMTDGGLV